MPRSTPESGAPTKLASQSPQAPTVSPSPSGPTILRIWVPPQFDPAAETTAGSLLKARLDEFSKRRPGIRVEVRVKALEGTGGLLSSLIATSAAASLALPDLIALPRDMLEAAALKGVLHPYNDLTKILDGPDWYEYAQQLAHLQDSAFGLPFAGDALIMVYHPKVMSKPPTDWETGLNPKVPLVFPAADPQALFTITQYLARGGSIRDADGRPHLDANLLSDVFTFYAQAEQSGFMPYWLTQYQDDKQVWMALQENRADFVAVQSSHYLTALSPDLSAALILTPDGKPYTLATGWVWALATPHADHRALSVELAEFLTESSFLSSWTEALGYLPTRPSALSTWKNVEIQSIVKQVALSAHLVPSTDILTSLGGPLQQATLQVLKKQIDPLTAAQAAAQSLNEP